MFLYTTLDWISCILLHQISTDYITSKILVPRGVFHSRSQFNATMVLPGLQSPEPLHLEACSQCK